MNRYLKLLMLGWLVLAWGSLVEAQTTPPRATKSDKESAEQKTEPIDFDRAKELFRKRQRGDKLTDDEEKYLKRAMAARREQSNRGDASRASAEVTPREKTGLKPLSEMTADDRYKEEDGTFQGVVLLTRMGSRADDSAPQMVNGVSETPEEALEEAKALAHRLLADVGGA